MKTPSSYVQKNHFEDLSIGDKNAGVKTRGKYLRDAAEEVHFSLFSKIEPNCFHESKSNKLGLSP